LLTYGEPQIDDHTSTNLSISFSISCKLESRFWRNILDTTLCDKACQWLATRRWCSPCFLHQ